MTWTTLRFISLLLLATVGPVPAYSADPVQTPEGEQTRMESMKDFMRANPDCQQFTDQCSFCTVADGKAQCSTPQIACIKQAYQCTLPPSK
ncbi:hypothetical protein FHT86_001940 [Rhizobium sp. BK313]|nr:hypothetical protein [Rhizobium sp. BK313]